MFENSESTLSTFGAQQLRSSVKDAGARLEFYSVVMDRTISFDAYLTGLTDSFNCNWSGENVFGRMDPIYTFQNTQRAISLSFTVPNVVARKDDAIGPSIQMDKINRFFQFLYPKYDGSNNALTIKQSPLVRVKFGNLIANTVQYSPGNAKSNGLLVTINSLSMTPKIEHGFSRLFSEEESSTLIYPNFIDLSLSMNVAHEKDRFGSATMSEAAKSFPFGGFDKIATSIDPVAVTSVDFTDVQTPDAYENLDGTNITEVFDLDATSDTDYSQYGTPPGEEEEDLTSSDSLYGSANP